MADETMAPLETLTDCAHPQLVEWLSETRYEAVYQCTACSKKVAIPLRTLFGQRAEDTCRLIGLLFGPRWEAWMRLHHPPRAANTRQFLLRDVSQEPQEPQERANG